MSKIPLSPSPTYNMYAEEIGNENLGLIPLFNNNKKNSYTIILLKQRNISSQLLKFSKCNCEGLLNHYSAKKEEVKRYLGLLHINILYI